MDIMYEYQKNNIMQSPRTIFGQVMKDQDKWDGINWINEFKQINNMYLDHQVITSYIHTQT